MSHQDHIAAHQAHRHLQSQVFSAYLQSSNSVSVDSKECKFLVSTVRSEPISRYYGLLLELPVARACASSDEGVKALLEDTCPT